MLPEPLNEQALFLMKDAFKRNLRQHLGGIELKPTWELRAWSLALLELATECRERQFEMEDILHEKTE